jgi:hypothetical protein
MNFGIDVCHERHVCVARDTQSAGTTQIPRNLTSVAIRVNSKLRKFTCY